MLRLVLDIRGNRMTHSASSLNVRKLSLEEELSRGAVMKSFISLSILA